jgi:A/G-specific adenine glycosylase
VATEKLQHSVLAAHFAARLLAWHDQHGRHDLPWQQQISAYRVWVSEIMLQQTQVSTVIPYFQRFMARFPDVATLAGAPEDDVLHLWTGLGYYARARNLQAAARIVVQQHRGELPADVETLCTLPGIGRSTAGAICSIAHGQRSPILDGNVKRVLARCFAVAGAANASSTLRELWTLAEALTPAERSATYTQAIMDLGATVCTRSRPACTLCPMHIDCLALRSGNPTAFPARKARRSVPERRCQMLVIRNRAGEFLLEKRPSPGIWGGLWSFPEAAEDEDAATACDRISGSAPQRIGRGPTFRHTFSHFHLDITPVHLEVEAPATHVMEDQRLIWYKPGGKNLGLSAPVKRLIDRLGQTNDELLKDERT